MSTSSLIDRPIVRSSGTYSIVSPVTVMRVLQTLVLPLAIAILSIRTLTCAISDFQLDARGVPSDVPYIRCEACKLVVQAAVNRTNELSENGLTEIRLFDLVESLCDPTSINGKWARTIDLVERVRKIHLVQQSNIQDCKQECRTLALACAAVLDGVETELAERLYLLRKEGPVDEADIAAWFCDKKGISSACSLRTPLYPKERPTGPPFSPVDEAKSQVEDMVKNMNAQTQGGIKMMSTDGAKFNTGAADDNDGDHDEDDNTTDDDSSEDEEDNSTMDDIDGTSGYSNEDL